MKIAEKTFVSLSYTLTVDGQQVESVTAEAPLQFIFGAGSLLPTFEKHLEGLKAGDAFKFTLSAADGYGELIPEAVVELPKDIFMIDGVIEDGLLEIGNQLPMSDNQGNRMIGTVKAVSDSAVSMDFNHPMAGKSLNFEGKVVGVREATEADFMQGQMMGGCGCGCGEDGCGDGCGDGCEQDKGSCGCGC